VTGCHTGRQRTNCASTTRRNRVGRKQQPLQPWIETIPAANVIIETFPRPQ
jgi:hypothetical protein